MTAARNPSCDYCGRETRRVTGADVYRNRPDLRDKIIYQCEPCGAWVGCHPGTDRPLGRLANAELRQAKMSAHAAFDPIWKARAGKDQSAKKARGAAYGWLAVALGIKRDDCHIGMMDVATCRRVVEVCRAFRSSTEATQ